jgi:nitrite reductase/ring-hydroxylating ferredoxin subunit
MAQAKRLICLSQDLPERGIGVRFSVAAMGKIKPAFVVRYRGKAQAYVNSCAHIRVELDAQPGEFFDVAGLYLVCATHGAAYLPDTGYCVGGPCKGLRLVKLAVEEHEGGVYLTENEDTVNV